MRPSRPRTLLGVAMAGVVVGHSLAYFAALPNAGARAELLARTGHSYWHGAVLLALAVAALAFVRHVRDHLSLPLRECPGFLSVAAWLAVVQVSAYAAIEVGERVAAGYPVQQMFHSALPLIGIAIQLAVAVASTLLLRLLGRAAEALAGTLAHRLVPSPSPRLWAPGNDPHTLAQRLLWAACRGRAPPPGLLFR